MVVWLGAEIGRGCQGEVVVWLGAERDRGVKGRWWCGWEQR